MSKLLMIGAAIGTFRSLTVPEFDSWMLMFHLLLFAFALSGLALAIIIEQKELDRVYHLLEHTVLMAATPEEITDLRSKFRSGDLVGAALYETELFDKYSKK